MSDATDRKTFGRGLVFDAVSGYAGHQLATFEESVEAFQDSSQEWRRLFSELLGTFFRVLVAAGGGMMSQAFPGTISRQAAVVHGSATYGANYPASGFSNGDALWMEVVLTFGLVSVILGTASGAQNIAIVGAIGVGAYIALAGLWGSPISGASMYPARTFGPDAVGAVTTADVAGNHFGTLLEPSAGEIGERLAEATRT